MLKAHSTMCYTNMAKSQALTCVTNYKINLFLYLLDITFVVVALVVVVVVVVVVTVSPQSESNPRRLALSYCDKVLL